MDISQCSTPAQFISAPKLKHPLLSMESLNSPNFTYTMGKLSCSMFFYNWHLLCCYIAIVSGFLAIVTRFQVKLCQYHRLMGVVYVVAMAGVVYTSVFIHSYGLPVVSIVQYSLSVVATIVGYVLIRVWENRLTVQATELVQKDIVKQGYPANRTLAGLIKQKRIGLVRSSSLYAKVVSFKSLHGWLFVISWLNLVPKLFFQSEFTCSTYSVFKPQALSALRNSTAAPLNAGRFDGFDLTLVPEHDLFYDKKPWAHREGLWIAMCFLVPSFLYSVFGFGMLLYKRDRKETTT